MALACTWGGYADTNLDLGEFFGGDHTIAARFMLQFPRAYRGPMLSIDGSGTYSIGQGDYQSAPGGQVKLEVRIGSGAIVHAVDLAAGTWNHLAVTRSGSTFQLYLNGKAVGSSMSLTGTAPSGRLRFGKGTFDANLDVGGTQFYGLLDDVAVFKAALSQSRIAELSAATRLAGTEAELLAGYTFGYAPPGGLSATLARPVTRTPAAMIRAVSTNRDDASDAKQLPLALTSHMHLPFPSGECWRVIQGFESATGSHKGYASFCWDLALAGKPQSESNGAPFHAVAPGSVVAVREGASGPEESNLVTVRHDALELADYLHLKQYSAVIEVGDTVRDRQKLAEVGDTGVKAGAYHLHLAITNLGETRKGEGKFVTVPAPFANYEASDDQGATWKHVRRGIPTSGQWLRRYVTASKVRYTAVWRASTSSEIQVYGWTYDKYRTKYDELWPQGWRLKQLQPYVTENQVRYTAVWAPSTEGEIQVYGWTYDDYRKRYDELWPQGWRLKHIVPHVIDGEVRYTAAWRPSTEGEIQIYGSTYDAYRKKYDELWPQGWRLKLLQPHVVDGAVRYTAVFRPSNQKEIQVYGWTYDDYRNKYDELWPQGWRLKLIRPYVINGQVRYTAAWQPSTASELQVYGWTYEDLRGRYDVLWEKGWRLQHLCPYALG